MKSALARRLSQHSTSLALVGPAKVTLPASVREGGAGSANRYRQEVLWRCAGIRAMVWDCRLGRRESAACAPAGDFAEDPRLPRKVRGLLQVVVEVRDPAFIDPQPEMNGQQLIKHSPGLGKIRLQFTSIRELPGFQFGFCLAEVDGPVLRNAQGVTEYLRLTADLGEAVDEPFNAENKPARP